MKGFKKRLMVTFVLVVTVPIILILAFGTVIVLYQSSNIEQTYNIESDTVQTIANPMRVMSKMTSDSFHQLRLTASSSPEKLTDLAYLNKMNEALENSSSFLAVEVDNEVLFTGSEEVFSILRNKLPSYSQTDPSAGSDNGYYISTTEAGSYLVKHVGFFGLFGSRGDAYIITDVSNVLPQLRMTAVQSICAFAIILVITATLLIYWLYRSVLNPLSVLTDATNRIKNGDLDFSITEYPNDEFGQLCEDFEQMRVHLKELIEAQQQSEKDNKELISNISHDLKTPITSIKGYAEGLLDGVADTDEKRERYVKTIYNKASVMASLVDELSFYAKIDKALIPYNFTKLDVDNYFEDCIEELSLDMEVRNVTLKYRNNCKQQTYINADPEQLKRVINNIVGNALKYMNTPEGEIDLNLKTIGNFLQIEISDNGVGISADDLPYIFDRFYRADSSRGSKQGGSGLGLSIAKKIIEDHGGQIWALSEKGNGTSFLFTLPFCIDEDETEEEEALAEIEEIEDTQHRGPVRLFGRARERRFGSEKDTDN